MRILRVNTYTYAKYISGLTRVSSSVNMGLRQFYTVNRMCFCLIGTLYIDSTQSGIVQIQISFRNISTLNPILDQDVVPRPIFWWT